MASNPLNPIIQCFKKKKMKTKEIKRINQVAFPFHGKRSRDMIKFLQTPGPICKNSKSRINLIHNSCARICIPSRARFLRRGENVVILDIVWSLQDIGIETSANVPRDVAMERPDARVIRGDLPDQVTICSHELHVSSLRVRLSGNGNAVPISVTFVKDLHVVSVQMHGVRCGGWVVDYDANGSVAAEVSNVPFIGVGEISLIGEGEDWTVIVCTERCSAKCPKEGSSFIDVGVDIEVLGCGRCFCGEGIIGFGGV